MDLQNMTLLTMVEAAKFLRMSRSSLYQRKDIPRFRRPGSRVILFDQQDLEEWMNRGRLTADGLSDDMGPAVTQGQEQRQADDVDIRRERVYHRNSQYR
jgi:predicted DNA-binding transcriptional regulator AlpA